MNAFWKRPFAVLFLLILTMLLIACGGGTAETPETDDVDTDTVQEDTAVEPAEDAEEAMDEAMEGPVPLSLWYHGAGNPEEREVILQIIDDFNASQGEYVVDIEEFPQESYNESVVAAALAGDLPDIIDMDGPVMPNWAWAGYIQPLNISEDQLAGFLPGAIGRWDGELYSVTAGS